MKAKTTEEIQSKPVNLRSERNLEGIPGKTGRKGLIYKYAMNLIMRRGSKKTGSIRNSRELFNEKFPKIGTFCCRILTIYIANMNLYLLFKREKGKINNFV